MNVARVALLRLRAHGQVVLGDGHSWIWAAEPVVFSVTRVHVRISVVVTTDNRNNGSFSALHQGHHSMRNDSVVSGNDASSMEVWRAIFFCLHLGSVVQELQSFCI